MQKTFHKIELQCDNCGAKTVIEYAGDAKSQELAYAEAGWKMTTYRAGDSPGYDYYDSSYLTMDLCENCKYIEVPFRGMLNHYGR